MTMNEQDAMKILGLVGDLTPELTKKEYQKACMKYHPDRNPAGLEMMKLVNVAYETLKDFTGASKVSGDIAEYGEDIYNALKAIITLGLDIEVCGAWVWVGGNTKEHKEVLKENGFKWAPKKLKWYYRPSDYKSFNRGTWSMDQIRTSYGSDKVIKPSTKRLTA